MKRERKEEIANWITHGLAWAFSVAGVVVLLAHLGMEKGASYWVSIGVYSASLILLYSASTIYHLVSRPTWKHVWRIIDHSAIYVKIAGTYTPFLVLALSDHFGWLVLGIMWFVTITGIVFKAFFVNQYRILSTVLYLVMGWTAIAVIKPLYDSVSTEVFVYLIAGGVSFTVGVVFYLWEKLPYHHSVWHAFVAGGSALHYVSIYLLVS